MMRWFLIGMVIGSVLYGMEMAAQPQNLVYGRTTLGVNTPVLVSTDGTLHIQ